jgi:hypothetical protein
MRKWQTTFARGLAGESGNCAWRKDGLKLTWQSIQVWGGRLYLTWSVERKNLV